MEVFFYGPEGGRGMKLYMTILRDYEFVLRMIPRSKIGSPDAVCRELKYLADYRGLFARHFRVGDRITSGYDHVYTMNKLFEMKTFDFRAYFEALGKAGHEITNCWVVQYLWSGKHDWHRDKGIRGTHRWIMSLGCLGKEFWLKCGDGQVKHMLRHGSVVCMNKKTSGMTDGTFKHAGKGDATGSFAVVFETKFVG